MKAKRYFKRHNIKRHFPITRTDARAAQYDNYLVSGEEITKKEGYKIVRDLEYYTYKHDLPVNYDRVNYAMDYTYFDILADACITYESAMEREYLG
jgi:hypothetical protein